MNKKNKHKQTRIGSNSPDSDIDIVEGLPAAENSRKVIQQYSSRWSGPLPPPDVFKQYPAEVQTAIVEQSKTQMKHRHEIENKVVDSNITNAGRGMHYAFGLTLAMIIAGTSLVALGESTAGLIAIFGTGGFQAGNFLLQKWREMQRVSKQSETQNNRHVKKNDP